MPRGAVSRVMPLPVERPPARMRLLVAYVGLYRHFRAGMASLHEQVILPNEGNDTAVSIALFTDNVTVCSAKERVEGRCDCIEPVPDNLHKAVRETVGHRLVRVHASAQPDFPSRLADAWENGLRRLSHTCAATPRYPPDATPYKPVPRYPHPRPWPHRASVPPAPRPRRHDAVLVMRPDSRLSRPRVAREFCGPTFLPPPGSADAAPGCASKCGGRAALAFLACSRVAAAIMFSHDADESEAQMRSDTLNGAGRFIELLRCAGERVEHSWRGRRISEFRIASRFPLERY